jgi:2-methylaconitate cis-trans-isomerase PrpF
MQEGIPVTIMRGGSSRALVFHTRDLPADTAEQDRIFLAALGCPDPDCRQVDGLGGTSSTTNKVAIVGPSEQPGVDVDYSFAQLAMDRDFVDRRGSCGNISAAIGPFAIEEGLVPATEPTTTVTIRNTNTERLIVAHVPTAGGRFACEGDYTIPGVPGCGARVGLEFVDPAGSVTGRLLPTGREREVLSVPGVGDVEVSLVDAANPVAFLRFEAVGLEPSVRPERIDGDPELLARIEAVRAAACVAMGLASDPAEATAAVPAVPKLIFVAPGDGEADLVTTGMSMGRVHRALQVTGAVCVAAAAAVPGSVVHDALGSPAARERLPLRLRHPAGVMDVDATVRTAEAPDRRVERVGVGRTARRVMAGTVYVPAEAAVPALA